MKIITHGKFGKELAENYKTYATYNLQIDYHEIISQEILDTYDGWAAFSPPKNLDISHIKWIHSFAAGVDPYTSREDLNPELILTKSVGQMDRKMAEYCLTQIMLNAQNSLPLYDKQKVKSWFRIPPKSVAGETVVILGTGFMGKGISKLLHSIGMNTIGVNSSGKDTKEFDATVSFNEFIKQPSDVPYIICTLPSTKENYHLLDSTFFQLFKQAHFINCGRGEVVAIDDLLEALEKGDISLASLDVFEEEPLASNSNLWANPNIIITPHQAAITNFTDVKDSFALALKAMINNTTCELVVNLVLGY